MSPLIVCGQETHGEESVRFFQGTGQEPLCGAQVYLLGHVEAVSEGDQAKGATGLT